MPVSDDYFVYPKRGYGMDHERYAWSNLFERGPVALPGNARVALWVTPLLQWFPLNSPAKPFVAPGGLSMPYPDFRHYTNRDYGNRVGIFRIVELLQELGVKGSAFLNGAIAERYPYVVRHLVDAGFEIAGHGLDMGHVHHGGLSEADEAALVERALGLLRSVSGQEVRGWLSPGRAQSYLTPEILVRNGIAYCCDWANDDMPFEMKTKDGDLLAMPYAYETDDRVCLHDYHHTDADWLVQSKDRFDCLYREAAERGGRVMSIPLHAWVMGVPYRLGYVRELLEYILSHEGVWVATGAEIADLVRRQP